MAKKQPQQQQPKGRPVQNTPAEANKATTPTPAPSARRREETQSKVSVKEPLVFGRINYILMLAGVALIGLGMFAMSGGQQPNPETWDPNIIYSTRIIHIAPILILGGLVVEVYAIFKKA